MAYTQKQKQEFEERACTAIESMGQASAKLVRAAGKSELYEEQHRAIVIAIEEAARQVRAIPVISEEGI